jgi:hypothetical protein
MRQAVGLQQNKTAWKPRALPWAGMNQAFGLGGSDAISASEWMSRAIFCAVLASGTHILDEGR